ncbi:MAG: hypothetical protein OIF57_01690 [Marinobacterium sp.]|nr:hypothetical protein [Marinobacterium sp.]
MKVTGSQLNLNAQHRASSHREQHERLQTAIVGQDGRLRTTALIQQDSISLSAEAENLASRINKGDSALRQQMQGRDIATDITGAEIGSRVDTMVSARLQANAQSTTAVAFGTEKELTLSPQVEMMKQIIEALSGVKIDLGMGQQLEAGATSFEPAQPGLEVGAMGMRYEAWSYYEETESLQFGASGRVTLADGRQLDLNFAMSMERNFVSQDAVRIEVGVKVQDPLVINFSGQQASLTEQKYSFDLDADGNKDQISFVSPGSGMLALDRNNNGKIDNGHELFGARTGNGFAELAQYDEDGNGFIDEGDSVYGQLKLWVKGPQGQDQYHSLADKDVGAIYLGAINTQFSFKDSENTLQGELRRSSIYLGDSGSVGSVQQIDLVV